MTFQGLASLNFLVRDTLLGTFLSLDWGQKKVGFATSDDQGIVITPRGSFARKGIKKEATWTLTLTDIHELKKLVEKFEIEKIILGYPLTRQGEDGPAACGAKHLSTQITKQFMIPVELVDEYLSSWEARKEANEDASAAAIILRDYFS